MIKKRFLSFVSMCLIGLLLFLNFSSVAFAMSVAEGATGYAGWVHDVEIDSSGNVHAAVLQIVPQGETDFDYLINYLKYDGSWSSSTVHSDEELTVPSWKRAIRIALDSNNYPGIAWTETTDGVSDIFYQKWNGTNWGSIYDVTGEDDLAKDANGFVAFDFFNDGADTDYPHIIHCLEDGDTGSVVEHTWNGSVFGADTVISTDTSEACVSADMEIDSSDNIYLLTSPDNGAGTPNYDVNYYYHNGTSWASAVDVSGATAINQGDSNGNYPIQVSIDSLNNPSVVVWDDNTSGDDDVVHYKKNGGSWDESTIASGTSVGSTLVDVGHDSNNYDYVAYWDSPNDKIYVENNSSGSFPSDCTDSATCLELDDVSATHSSDGVATAAIDYDSNAGTMVVIGSFSTAGPPSTIEYTVSSLPTPGSVPEFNTYVYVMLILVAMGIFYFHYQGRYSNNMIA
jgi:hypothetical protein